MKSYLMAAVVSIFALTFVGGCGKPTPDSVAKEMVGKMKEMAGILHGVTDESSAKAAGDKLTSLQAEFKKIKTEADALPKPTPEEEKRLKDTYGKDVMDATQNVQTEMMRIGRDPKMFAPIKAAMENFKFDR